MRYVATNSDGSIAVIILVPVAVVRQSDGAELKVLGTAHRILYTEAGEFIMDSDIADLHADSIPDHTIRFPDPVTEIVGKWTPEARDAVAAIRECAKSEIPADRYFRGAWTDTGKIDVDMSKAREIHKDVLRSMRTPLLAALDTEYLKADETGDSAEKLQIALRKQALRNVTDSPAIAAAATPEELKAVIPLALR